MSSCQQTPPENTQQISLTLTAALAAQHPLPTALHQVMAGQAAPLPSLMLSWLFLLVLLHACCVPLKGFSFPDNL